jgi:hypothetical protein
MTVIAFDSPEELFEHLRKNNDLAQDALEAKPWAMAAGPGDYIVYFGGAGFPPLVGEILKNEYPEDQEMLDRGNRVLINGYSPMCPQGEMGTIHLSAILGWITKDVFDKIVESCASYDMELYETALMEEQDAFENETAQRILNFLEADVQ